MIDVKLNSNNDLAFTAGDLELIREAEDVSPQSLRIRLYTFRGEWFLNTTRGIPYLQRLLQKGVSKDFIDAVFTEEASKSYAIASVDSITSEINDRRYTAVLRCTLVNGTPITINNIEV